MSLTNSALSGLRSTTTDLEVTGNNIANSSTVGFKQSRAEFSDLFVSGVLGSQVGNGVQVSGVSQEFRQVGFSVTGASYDMALDGDGFFMTKDANDGSTKYTRAGNFTVDQDGYITTQRGDRVQGYSYNNGQMSASVTDLKIPLTEDISPEPTSKIDIDMNLDATSTAIVVPFDVNDSATFNDSTSVELFDSLGNTHSMSTYYTKTADNNWDINVYIDNIAQASGTLVFDNAGLYSSSTGLTGISWNPGSGAAPGQNIEINYVDTTQYGSETMVRSSVADGYKTGRPTDVLFDNNGIASVQYSNSEYNIVGQIAVARFENPQGLFGVGDTSWIESNESGSPQIAQDNSNGVIRTGALEDSNVELTEQLVRLIKAQRTFQANAQSIRAADVIMQTVINIT